MNQRRLEELPVMVSHCQIPQAPSPSPPLDNIRVMVIVWRLRWNIIRTALCWIVWHNVHSQQHTYVSSSYRSNKLSLSHWDPYAVRRGGCLELYYCNMVECSGGIQAWSLTTNWFPSVLWHCWFGHLACKNYPRKTYYVSRGTLNPTHSHYHKQLQWVNTAGIKETLACPCLPVFDVDMSTILHALPFITTKPFLRRAEHCIGNVSDAPDPVLSNSPASAMVRACHATAVQSNLTRQQHRSSYQTHNMYTQLSIERPVLFLQTVSRFCCKRSVNSLLLLPPWCYLIDIHMNLTLHIHGA